MNNLSEMAGFNTI